MVAERLPERHDGDVVDAGHGALRRGVVPPDGLDGVADELDADRLCGSGGKYVEDTAAHAELAVLIDRILMGEPRLGKQIGERPGGDVVTGSKLARDPLDFVWPRHPGQQGNGGRDDDPGRAGGRAVKRARAGRRDVEVRREAAVRVHFLGRERQDTRRGRLGRNPLDRAEKQPHVRDQLLDVGIGRHHRDDRPSRVGVREAGERERLRRRREACQRTGRRVETRADDRRLEQRAECQRRGGRHREPTSVRRAGRLSQAQGATLRLLPADPGSPRLPRAARLGS